MYHRLTWSVTMDDGSNPAMDSNDKDRIDDDNVRNDASARLSIGNRIATVATRNKNALWNMVCISFLFRFVYPRCCWNMIFQVSFRAYFTAGKLYCETIHFAESDMRRHALTTDLWLPITVTTGKIINNRNDRNIEARADMHPTAWRRALRSW